MPRKVPAYSGVLPKVFPYKWRCTFEQAEQMISVLMNDGVAGYAVTSHPATLDGHVYMWMSIEVASLLVRIEAVNRDWLETA